MLDLIAQPAFWASIALLIGMELVLGADNVRYTSGMTAQLPEDHRHKVLRVSLIVGAVFRLVILFIVAWMLGLERVAFDLAGWAPSWREVILIAGGLFLIYRAVTDLHALVEPSFAPAETPPSVPEGLALAVAQIALIQAVLSVDMVIMAMSLSPYVWAMAIAAIASVAVLYVAADRIGAFVSANPAVKALALAILLMAGIMLVADGLGMELVRPYLYLAIAFAVIILAVSKALRIARHKADHTSVSPQEPAMTGPEPVVASSAAVPKFAEVRTEPVFEPEPPRDEIESVELVPDPEVVEPESTEAEIETVETDPFEPDETPEDTVETPIEPMIEHVEPVETLDESDLPDPDERPLGVSDSPVPKSRPKRKPVQRRPERLRTGSKKRE